MRGKPDALVLSHRGLSVSSRKSMLSYTLYRKSFGLSLLYLLFCLFFFVKKDEDFSLIFSREHEKSNISFVHAVTWSHSSYGASSGRGGGRIRRETPSSCSPHLLLTSRSRRQNLVASLSPSCSSSSSSFSSPIDLSISPSNLFLSSLSPVNPSSPLSSSSRGALRTNDLSNRCFSFISPSCSPLTTSLSSCSSARLLPVSSPHALSTSLCSSSGFSPLIERKNDDEFPSCLYSQLPSSSLSSFIQEPDRFFPLKTLGNFFSSPLFLSPYISRLSRRREASCFASLSSPRDHRIQTPSSDFLDLSLVSSPTAFFYYSSSSSFSSPSSSVSPLLLLFQGATRPSPLHSRQLLQATREVQHPTDSLTESKEEREELESAGQIGDDTGGAGEGHFVHAEDMPSHSFPSDSTNSSYTNEAEYYEPSSEGGGEREKSFFSPGEDEEIDNEGEGMAWIDTHHPHDDRERRDSAVELSLEKSGGDRREKATPSPSSYHLNGREEGYRHLSTPGTSRGSTRQRRRYPALSSVSSSSFPNDYGTMPAGEGRDEEEDDRSTSSSSRRVSPVYGDYEGDTPPFSNTRGLRREGERRMRSSPSSFAGVEGGGRTRRSFSSFQGNEEEREREKIRRQEGLIPSGETTGEDKGYSSSTASISGVQTPRRLQGGRRRFNRRGTWEGSFRERRSLTSSSSRFSSISSSQTEHTTSPSPNQEGEGDEEAYRSSSSSTRPISDNETRETDYFYPLDERRDGANEAFPALRSRGDINLQGNWRGGERPYRGRRSFSPTLREDSISSNLPMPRSSSSTSSGKEGTRSEGGIVAYAGEDTNKNLWRDPRIERGEREQDGDLGYERRRPQLEEGLQGRQEEEGQGRRARSISLKRHNFGSPSSLYDGEEHKESRHSSTSFLPRENKTVGEGQKDDERKDASEEGQGERRGSPSSRLSSSFFPSYENDEASSREGGRREFFENRREEYSRRRGTRWLWSRGTRDQQWHEAPSAGADRRREGYRYAEEDLESDRQRDPSKHHVVMPPPEGYPTNQIPRENSLQVEGGEDDRNMLFSQRQRGIRNPLSRRGILYRPPFPRIRGRRPLFPYSRRRFSRGIRGRDAYYLSHPPRPYMTHFYRGDRRAYRNPFFSPSSLGQRRETAPDALGREGRGGDELDEFGDTVDGETRRESGRDRGIEMIRRRGLWRRREEDTEEIPSMPSLPVLLRSLDVGLLLCGGRGRRSSCHSSPDRKENVTDLATDISTLPPPPSPDGTESLTIATSDGDLHGRREENEHERREEEKRNEGNHEKPLSQISSLLDQSSHIHLVGQEEQEDKPSMTGRRRGEEEVAQHTTSLLERAMEEELPLSLEDESIGDLIDDRMRRKLLLLPPIDPHSTVDTPDVQAMRDFTSSLLHVPSPDKKDQAGQDREEEEEKGQATREEEQEAHRHHRTSSGLSENARTLGAPHPGEEQRSSKWYSFKKVYQEALEKFTGHGGDTEQREGVEMNEKIEQVYAYAAFIRRALASRQRRKVTLDAALQRHQIPF
ncbi:transmembrane protein, partial [Cystoisospora suis]